MSVKRFFIGIPLFLFSVLCWSQEVYNISTILNSETSFDIKTKRIDSTIKVMYQKGKIDSIDQYVLSYIRWLYKKKQFLKEIEVIQADIKNQENRAIIDTSSLQIKLQYLGFSYYKLKKYSNSIGALQQLARLNINNRLAGKAYSQLGRCYTKIGDFYTAIRQYELGQSLHIKNEDYKGLLENYINISQTYTRLGTLNSYKKSRHYLLKADSLSKHTVVKDYYKYYIKVGLGKTYNQNKTLNIDKATAYYNQALAIAQQNSDSSSISEAYNHLGNTYNTTNPKLGIDYQQKAILNTPRYDSLRLHVNHVNIGFCYAINDSYDQAITSFYKALSLLEGLTSDSMNNDLHAELFYLTPYKDYALIILKNLAHTYFEKYKESLQLQSLNKAIQMFLVADKLIDVIQIESKEFESKLYWRKQSSELYGRAIEACFLANDIDKAFYFMEKNKALLLTENLKNAQLRQSLVLPDSLIDKEIILKKSIYNLSHQKPTKENKDSLAIAILGEQQNLQNLQNNIKESFSDYKTIDFKTSVIDIKALQNSLDDNTVVLEYNISAYDDYSLITPENGYTPVIKDCKYGVKTHHPSYGLLITNSTVDFFEIEGVERLKNDLQKVITKMSKPFKTDQETKSYNEISHVVFEKLFPSEKIRQTIKNKKLRIIPDNTLNYLSFEALVTSIHPDGKPKYLIQDTEISYAYSNSFLTSININSENIENSFLAFAPGTYEAQQLVPLITSEEEINMISNYFTGVSYTQEKATKERFLATFSDYDIVHLATHADAQDSISPWIAFRKNKLFEEELYLTTNKAKLVVLSGCNTLLGKQETGEGVMSLARGFFYSGAESVVSSLWNVNDRSTSYIMNEFYKNLSNDQSKSEALRNAKISYLENHMFIEISPSNWASLVLLGDSRALSVSPYSKYWWFLVLPILLLGYFIYKKRRNS